MRVEAPDENRPFTAAVIVLSDKGSRGEREDLSGPAAEEMLKEAGYDVVERFVIPDEPEVLKHHLIRLADSRQVDLVVTSGGTGFSMRDQTPEATLAVADRNAPGIAEYIRMKSMQITDRAMLSRRLYYIVKERNHRPPDRHLADHPYRCVRILPAYRRSPAVHPPAHQPDGPGCCRGSVR